MSTILEIENAIYNSPAQEFRILAASMEKRKGHLAGECAMLSQESLAVDWNKPQQEQAWIHLQLDQ
jgi:hypothetical protein